MVMWVYSLALTLGLAVSAPWWGWRMATSGRYREGLAGRLGRVPREVRAACAGKRVVWVHAVSVGEVLAVARLVADLRAELGAGWVVAVSTTTATGQKIARERLGAGRAGGEPGCPVFWFPLDFAFAVRACLRALHPELLVLVEGELWPRVLWECERGGVPVAVVNARVSDRSYRRTLRVRSLWLGMARRVKLWLAQGEETAERLRVLGVAPERVQVPGNLKFDLAAAESNAMAQRLRSLRGASRIIVAGSTLEGEEQMLLSAWPAIQRGGPDIVLLLAPRHPQRFAEVAKLLRESGFPFQRCSELMNPQAELHGGTILLLDSLGDLASVYMVAQAAFIGGSLVPRGGHNPLEAARFGVPVVMGRSYENFREIVEGLKAAGGIRLIDSASLGEALVSALRNGQGMGRNGRDFYKHQAGATRRTVAALLALLVEREHA